MFIQVKDIQNKKDVKDANIFIIKTIDNNPIYISRSFADHDISKYTSKDKERAIIYFNRQAAEEAINTSFTYTGLKFQIEKIAVNNEEKEDAKRADAIRRMMKNQARRERGKSND